MQEAARGDARTRTLARLVGLVVLIVTMTAVFPVVSDARLPDSDGDGLADRVELRRLHTNPRKADTDRDTLRDGVEAHVTRTNPRRVDTDRDGLTDGFEVKGSKTKPRRFDTDGDGTGDGLELLLSRNPLVRDGRKKKLIDNPIPEPPPVVPEPPPPSPDPPPTPDILPPETSISSGPSGTVATGSASFGFTSSETGSTFECRLDAGAWGSCSSPKAYSGLTNAAHTFIVRATDAAGNADLTPATRTWTVNVPPPDTTPPNTTISSGPSNVDERLSQRGIHLVRDRLDAPMPARRRCLGLVHLAEGVFRPCERFAYVRRARHGRGCEHRRFPGQYDMDGGRAAPAA